jgi:hypothetical protein
MIERLFLAIATWLIERLWAKASKDLQDAEEQMKEDKENAVTDKKNVDAYKLAKSREERRKRALDLLNRNHF